jgi:hypothetical protein
MKAAKMLYRCVQRIRYVVRVDVIPIAIKDVFVDRLCDHRPIYILHRPEDTLGKLHPYPSEWLTADHIVAMTLLKPANNIAAAR